MPGLSWDKVQAKIDYINDPLSTLPKIAKKYGVKVFCIRAVSRKEGWAQGKSEKQQAKRAQETGDLSVLNALVRQELYSLLRSPDLEAKKFAMAEIMKYSQEKPVTRTEQTTRNSGLESTLAKSLNNVITLDKAVAC
jgi:hypothetical protein